MLRDAEAHRLVCPLDCPDTCSMLVTVKDGHASRLRGDPAHPFTQGFLCHKVSHYLERVYNPQRVLHPLRRIGPKGSGQFERIDWDTALDLVVKKFREVIASPEGPQAILPYSYCGTMGRIQSESLDRRFFHRIGASMLDRTICATAGVAGYTYTIGGRIGTDPEAIDDSRYIINWGSNTAVTNSHLWVRMVAARKRGAKIVTIDPYRSRTAERSDWHLMPRVGTDAALALGIMHVLFRDGLTDDDYLTRYCHGTDALRDRVMTQYSVAAVAKITGLAAADIERLAHEYATTKPAVIRVNYGLQRHYGGGMAVRTIACLPALIGAWRDASGGILLTTSGLFPINTAGLQRPLLSPPGTRTINMSRLADALCATGSASVFPNESIAHNSEEKTLAEPVAHSRMSGPPVRLLFVYNSNPAAIAPDTARVMHGLKRDDLFTVVHEQFLTDTTDYADIVLPATTQLEHTDLHTTYGHHYVQLNEPAIAPLGEARCNTDVFRLLASRLGLEPELFAVTDEQLAKEALWETAPEQPSALRGITVDVLRNEGPQRLRLPRPFVPFAEGNFPTPTGKCEFFATKLAEQGEDPLPWYAPPAESVDSQPELAARFPLQLLSPPSPHFLNSTFVETESLRKSAGEPTLEMHPDDAEERDIIDGQRVRIFNDRGSFQAKVLVGETVRPGVVVAPGIWWSKLTNGVGNANLTTSSRTTDWGGGATFFDNLVEVEAIGAEGFPLRAQNDTE